MQQIEFFQSANKNKYNPILVFRTLYVKRLPCPDTHFLTLTYCFVQFTINKTKSSHKPAFLQQNYFTFSFSFSTILFVFFIVTLLAIDKNKKTKPTIARKTAPTKPTSLKSIKNKCIK